MVAALEKGIYERGPSSKAEKHLNQLKKTCFLKVSAVLTYHRYLMPHSSKIRLCPSESNNRAMSTIGSDPLNM